MQRADILLIPAQVFLGHCQRRLCPRFSQRGRECAGYCSTAFAAGSKACPTTSRVLQSARSTPYSIWQAARCQSCRWVLRMSQVYKYSIDYSSLLILSGSGFSSQPANPDFPIGGNYGQVPFEADRNNWGFFGEWLFPILKAAERHRVGAVR